MSPLWPIYAHIVALGALGGFLLILEAREERKRAREAEASSAAESPKAVR